MALFRLDFRVCVGFRMPAHGDGAACTGAGVRKPPKNEPAAEVVLAMSGEGRAWAAEGSCDSYLHLLRRLVAWKRRRRPHQRDCLMDAAIRHRDRSFGDR